MQQGKLAFVMNKLDAAEKAAEQGIVLVKQVKTTEEDIKKASDHTQRDLLNLLVRVKAKKEGRDATIVRKEIADKYSMGTTFLEIHDKQQERLQQIHEALRIEINKKEKEAKQQQSLKGDPEQEDDEEDEGGALDSSAMYGGALFCMLTAGTTALSYMYLNKDQY